MNKETLEEAAENTFGLVDPILGKSDYRMGYESGLIKGVKWQAEKSYSEEEVINILLSTGRFLRADLDIWFKQFKK